MSDEGQIARKWWRALSDTKYGDRAAMARLRRCETPVDALTVAPALALSRALQRNQPDTSSFQDALGLAILLAHVKEDDTQHLMRAAGWKTFPGEKKETEAGADHPLLSELRFRRLIQTASDEKLTAFKRLVRIMSGKVDVVDLAESYLFWGDKRRERWAFDYFAAGSAQPAKETDMGESE